MNQTPRLDDMDRVPGKPDVLLDRHEFSRFVAAYVSLGHDLDEAVRRAVAACRALDRMQIDLPIAEQVVNDGVSVEAERVIITGTNIIVHPRRYIRPA